MRALEIRRKVRQELKLSDRGNIPNDKQDEFDRRCAEYLAGEVIFFSMILLDELPESSKNSSRNS